MVKLSTNLIYDAAFDDELFSELPSIVADAIDARSCVLHWRGNTGAAEIFTHSGYFSDANMADYAVNFADHDLWTHAGMRHGYLNRAWRTTDLVTRNEYEHSIFYNEWIRAMGDDTFYCAGSVMQTRHGQGCIGLHRGKTQADFSPFQLNQLNRHVDHLRRMFAMRGRMASLADRNNLLNAIFASGREAALVLSADGRIVMTNEAGDTALKSGRFIRSRNGRVEAATASDGPSFERVLATASLPGDQRGSDCLLHSRAGDSVVVSLIPLSAPVPHASVLMTVAEPRARLAREIVAQHLARSYGLTGAEVDVALRLADGQSLEEIGAERRSATGTVRNQVKHILMKMDAKRQSDVVRMVVAAYHPS